MDVINKLAMVVTRVPGVHSFMYDDWYRVDRKVSKLHKSTAVTPSSVQLPGCFVILPASGQFYNHNGNFRDWPNLTIAFMIEANRQDLDGLQNDTLVEQMKELAKDFILAYNASCLFEPLPDIIAYQPLYSALADVLTGVQIQIQAKPLRGDCIPHNPSVCQ